MQPRVPPPSASFAKLWSPVFWQHLRCLCSWSTWLSRSFSSEASWGPWKGRETGGPRHWGRAAWETQRWSWEGLGRPVSPPPRQTSQEAMNWPCSLLQTRALGGVGIQHSRLAPWARSLGPTLITDAPKWASVTSQAGRTRRTQDSQAKALRLLRVDVAGGGQPFTRDLTPLAGTGGTRVLLARSHSEGLWEALWPLHSTPDLVSDRWGRERRPRCGRS